MFHFAQAVVFLPIRLSFPTKYYGKKNLPKGACIIASNHTSNLDAILLALHTWEKKYYLKKKELYTNKLRSAFLNGIGLIKIDRQANDLNAIKNGLKVLKDGKKLVIFPEGKRVNKENGELGEVKQGVSMFAIKAKVPVVPMYIAKKPKFWRRNKVYIGEPFTLEEFYGQKLTSETLEKASEIVATKINELREYAISLTKKK